MERTENIICALEGMSDDDDIPDINQKLADWLKSKYDARTVDGFQEGKQIKLLFTYTYYSILKKHGRQQW